MKPNTFTWFGFMICILQLVSTSSSSTSNSVNQLISMTKRDVTVENLQNKLKRMQTIQENDIVFLVDGSGSVLYENFKFELIFVRKVLNAFNVNLNFTRVAVVPFSTPNVKETIYDQISNPLGEIDKCSLEWRKIKYTDGSTGTYEAFVIAERILLSSNRLNSQKTIMLITDGYSNSADPIPKTREIKSKNINIITFGVFKGNILQLRDIASLPLEENCFFLEDFADFAKLSSLSLHKDILQDSYMPRRKSLCDHLCYSGDCCDTNAFCACGSNSGHYQCTCDDGFYGDGLSGNCKPCKNGTYWETTNMCKQCPDPNHITLRDPAIGVSDCVCKPGFRPYQNNQCEIVTCPMLTAPVNGYVVSSDNSINGESRIRCKSGYVLKGDSKRTCLNDGNWSGNEATCESFSCPELTIPKNANLTCLNRNTGVYYTHQTVKALRLVTPMMPIDTECTFACALGWTLGGSSHRNCRVTSKWDGREVTCNETPCPKLPRPGHLGQYVPHSCISGPSPIGSVCTFECPLPGFQAHGIAQKQCQGEGTGKWTHSSNVPLCKDIESPTIVCPANYSVPLNTTSKIVLTSVRKPIELKDNSQRQPFYYLTPDIVKHKIELHLGNHPLNYTAQDSFGNEAKCSFNIEVVDISPPVIENCTNQTIVLEAMCADPSNKNSPKCQIDYDKPTSYDNSNQKTNVMITQPSRIMGTSIYQSIYTATDLSSNTNVCVVNITVEYEYCRFLTAPKNGIISCTSDSTKSVCQVHCNAGHAIYNPVLDVIYQNLTLKCDHKRGKWPYAEVPDCAEVIQKSLQIDGFEVKINPNVIQCVNGSNADFQSILKNIHDSICLPGDICDFEYDAIPDCSANPKTNQRMSSRGKRSPLDNIRDRDSFKNAFTIRLIRYSQPTSSTNKPKNNLDAINQLKRRADLNILGVKQTKSSLVCSPGSVSVGEYCVKCTSGTFHDVKSNRCVSCDIGFYSSVEGQTVCEKCPKNQSTKKKGSKLQKECESMCPPGTRAKIPNALTRRSFPDMRTLFVPFCVRCLEGYFQPKFNQIKCLMCPLNFTSPPGSKSKNDCYLPNSDQACTPENNLCENQGECVMSANKRFQCKCAAGFYGWRCKNQVDPCSSGPCFNDGVCQANGNQFTCNCSKEFEGRFCELSVSKCRLGYCQNNANCIELFNGEVQCSCSPGFKGEHCEIKHDECSELDCEHGECVISRNGAKCDCHPGYLGRRCNHQPCDFAACPRNRFCENIWETVTTKTSYSCETKSAKNACKPNPCRNNGVCVENPRRGGPAGFSCECPYYYFGSRCETLIRPNFEFHFDHADIGNYVQLPGPTRNLTEISACVWTKTNKDSQGTILSYATAKSDNMFTISDVDALTVYVNGNYISTGLLLSDNLWHFICVAWMSENGYYEVYLDGSLTNIGQNLSRDGFIEANGNLMIGQEQDGVGTGLNVAESFVGQMANLDVWDRFLAPTDIAEMFTSCDPYQGNLYAWSQFKSHVTGSIEILPSRFCKMCAETLSLSNGRVFYGDNLARYECFDGFRLEGDAIRECGRDSNWKLPEPVCKRK